MSRCSWNSTNTISEGLRSVGEKHLGFRGWCLIHTFVAMWELSPKASHLVMIAGKVHRESDGSYFLRTKARNGFLTLIWGFKLHLERNPYFMEAQGFWLSTSHTINVSDLSWDGFFLKQVSSLSCCPGFGWDRVNFLLSSWYSAVFWILCENNADNTLMF